MREAAGVYYKKHGVTIDVSGGGSDIGVQAAIQGTADIGMVSRALHENEEAALTAYPIGQDIVVPIVNSSNPVHDISLIQLRDVYLGSVRRWSSLGGVDRPITIIAKKDGRSTQEIWNEFFGLPETSLVPTHQFGANWAILLFVAADPLAIGYVSAGALNEAQKRGIRVRELTVGGKSASDLTHPNGHSLTRQLQLVTRGTPDPTVSAFLTFMQNDDGLAIVLRHGFSPLEKQP